MTSKATERSRFSLRRWSQRKLEAARAEAKSPPQLPMPAADVVAGAGAPAGTTTRALESSSPALPPESRLPPIESLTIDSDFAPFFKPQVDEAIKRAALKQLFRDPRFNIMDGLDTYIDDYTQADPIPASMLEELMQRRVFFPPLADETSPAPRVIDDLAADPATNSGGPTAPMSAAGACAPPVGPAVATPPAATVAEVSSGVPQHPFAVPAQSKPQGSGNPEADEP